MDEFFLYEHDKGNVNPKSCFEGPTEVGYAGSERQNQILQHFRCLIADLCEQHKSGHPGGAMSMAAIGVALYKYVMRYTPANPKFPNRDRLIMSNGHACLWQYILMHWTGYPSMTLDQLKSYRSAKVDSLCPGHPQIQHMA